MMTVATMSGGVQSVEVAGTVLRALLDAGGPAKLSHLARRTGMPTAKVRRYLVSLMRTGFVVQDPRTSEYDLGSLTMEIGLQGFARFDILKQAETTLDQIVDAFGETAAIGYMGPRGPAFVRISQPPGNRGYSIPFNHVCPITYSATGKLFSAFGDVGQLAGLIDAEIVQNARVGRPHCPHSAEDFARDLAAVRDRGYAVMEDGGGGEVTAVAVPVYDAADRLLFSLTVFAHLGRLNVDPDSLLIAMLLDFADALSKSLGRPDKAM